MLVTSLKHVYSRVVGYTMDVMYFAWLEKPVQNADELALPQFALREHILFDCSQNYTAGWAVIGCA